MAYCTQAELVERFGTNFLIELSDRGDTPAVAIDSDLITRAISDADAMIDGYLKPIYSLPLVSTPNQITDLSLSIAIYKAHGNVVSDKIKEDYKTALMQLKDIGMGRIKLDVAGVEPEGSGSSEVITNEKDQVMSADTLKGFI